MVDEILVLLVFSIASKLPAASRGMRSAYARGNVTMTAYAAASYSASVSNADAVSYAANSEHKLVARAGHCGEDETCEAIVPYLSDDFEVESHEKIPKAVHAGGTLEPDR
jgi:hypothetical protein